MLCPKSTTLRLLPELLFYNTRGLLPGLRCSCCNPIGAFTGSNSDLVTGCCQSSSQTTPQAAVKLRILPKQIFPLCCVGSKYNRLSPLMVCPQVTKHQPCSAPQIHVVCGNVITMTKVGFRPSWLHAHTDYLSFKQSSVRAFPDFLMRSMVPSKQELSIGIPTQSDGMCTSRFMNNC